MLFPARTFRTIGTRLTMKATNKSNHAPNTMAEPMTFG